MFVVTFVAEYVCKTENRRGSSFTAVSQQCNCNPYLYIVQRVERMASRASVEQNKEKKDIFTLE